MKTALTLLSAVLMFGSAQLAQAHGKFRVELEPVEDAVFGPGAFTFDFFLIDTDLDKLVIANDVGTQKLPLRVYDEKLGKLSHGEATFNPTDGTWRTTLELPYRTAYWVWAEGTLIDENLDFLGGGKILTQGDEPPVIDPLTDQFTAVDRGTRLTLSAGTIRAGQSNELTLRFSRDDGSVAEIPRADLYIATEDGDGLFHVVAGRDTAGTYVTRFTPPGRGKYRVWTLVRDGGQDRVLKLGFTAVR